MATSGKTTAHGNEILKVVLWQQVYLPHANLYLALTSNEPTYDVAGIEIPTSGGTNYSRTAIPCDAANWDVGTSARQATNKLLITLPVANADWDDEIPGYELWTSPIGGGGVRKYFGTFETPISILLGDQRTLPPGAIILRED